MDFGTIFFTGLAVGGFTCLALQGGLLASVIASREEQDQSLGEKKKHTIAPTLAFLVCKLIAYIALGFILGLFGQTLALSDTARLIIQFAAAIYMIAIALDLLNIHPIFRYAVIQPPKFLIKRIRNQSKNKELFAPALLGFMTIFIPCGTTLAMEAFAISSGSPILGALIMGTFVLGTFPLFFGVGFLTTVLGDAFKRKFFKLAGILVLYLGITSLNGSLVVAGSPITLGTLGEAIPIELNLGEEQLNEDLTFIPMINGVQSANIQVFPNGYAPGYIRVKKDIPVRLVLTTVGGYGCTSAFVIPQFGISKRLPRQGTDSVQFVPTKSGKVTWTCSMGMYFGTIEVI